MIDLLSHQTSFRLVAFISVFFVMACWEALAPKRVRVLPRAGRWISNLGLVIINSVALRIFVPVMAVAVAQWAAAHNIGLLSLLSSPLALPIWLNYVLAIILLDMCIYWQHVASHRYSFLWRLHKVHHADRDIDVTTGARFHPIEIVLSMIYKFLCIVTIGAPALAVLLFEVLLNASAMFNHANVRLSKNADSTLRKMIVTPDMHRVHHSVINVETNSNYGFFLSVWDRIFKSYQEQPAKGHQAMTAGLSEYQTSQPAELLWSLKLPFSDK